jgi:hypothetical protein
MQKTVVTCFVKNGKVDSNRSLLSDIIRSYEGKEVDITIERAKKKRSNQQNRWFHGVAIPIIRTRLLDLGWNEALSFEWTKDFIKANCLVVEFVNEKTGEVLKGIGKTSDLSTIEFTELKERVQQYAAETLDIQVPDPGEQITLF